MTSLGMIVLAVSWMHATGWSGASRTVVVHTEATAGSATHRGDERSWNVNLNIDIHTCEPAPTETSHQAPATTDPTTDPTADPTAESGGDTETCPAPDPARDSDAGQPMSWLATRCPQPGDSSTQAPDTDTDTDTDPDPYTDTSATLGECDPDELAEDSTAIIGVTASPSRHGVIALWTTRDIHVSRDDGRTFARVLDGPGTVTHVDVDCRGRVVALRGRDMLGVADSRASSWRRMPVSAANSALSPGDLRPDLLRSDLLSDLLSGTPALATGGGWIGWIGAVDREDHQLMALTHDLGRTWSFQRIDHWSHARHQFAISDNGDLQLYVTQGERCGEEAFFYRGSAERGTLKDLSDAEDPFAQKDAVLDGWTYSTSVGCGEEWGSRVCAQSPRGKAWRAVEPEIAVQDIWTWQLASNGRTHVFVADDVVYSVRRHRAKKLTTVPGVTSPAVTSPDATADGHGDATVNAIADWQLSAVDSSGRPLGLWRGHVVRWSPKHGWRVLTGAPSLP